MAVAFVAGALANKPHNGGEAWVRLSWILGLRRLGFDVFFVERLDREDGFGRQHFEGVVADFRLADRSALLDKRGEPICGSGERELLAAAAEAEVIFNISGHLPPGPLLDAPRHRSYVDLDPGFTQIWHSDPALDFEVSGYDSYVTVGLNIGRPGCPVPTGGLEWVHTLPPVLIDEWPVAPSPAAPPRFTSVGTWRSPYGPLPIGGQMAGLKHHEFRRVLDLPQRVPEARFELALAIHPDDRSDRETLRANGWALVSPSRLAATPQGFRSYLQGSDAEFSAAQGVYVASHSGWFSDRTAGYLASGRPVVVQETGLGGRLPLGDGLLTFGDLEGAAEGVRRIVADPAGHGEAARRIAEEHLDSDRVLGRLLETIGVEA